MALAIESALRELERWNPVGPPVLSLYLVTDPSTAVGFKLEAQFTDVIRPLAARITGKEEAKEFARNREAAWQAVVQLDPAPRGVAVFSSIGRPFFRLFGFSLRLASTAVWGQAPYLRPLFAALDEYEHTLVVFVDKQCTKLFRLLLGEVEEVQAFEDAIPRKHTQGGWEQAQLQRHHAMHVLWHIQRTTETLRQIADVQPVARILVTGSLEATAEFKRQLPKALQDRVIMADLPLSAQATPSEVSEAAMAFLKPIERINEQRLVAQLAEQRGLGQAVFGLSAVIKAILEQRADLLVFSAQVQFSGGHCPRCAFMASEPLPQACPLCGTLFQRDHDLVEYLIKRVREQGGHIEELHEEAAAVLGANGGIATRLRYTIPPIGRSRYYGEKNQVFQTGPPARH